MLIEVDAIRSHMKLIEDGLEAGLKTYLDANLLEMRVRYVEG